MNNVNRAQTSQEIYEFLDKMKQLVNDYDIAIQDFDKATLSLHNRNQEKFRPR